MSWFTSESLLCSQEVSLEPMCLGEKKKEEVAKALFKKWKEKRRPESDSKKKKKQEKKNSFLSTLSLKGVHSLEALWVTPSTLYSSEWWASVSSKGPLPPPRPKPYPWATSSSSSFPSSDFASGRSVPRPHCSQRHLLGLKRANSSKATSSVRNPRALSLCLGGC